MMMPPRQTHLGALRRETRPVSVEREPIPATKQDLITVAEELLERIEELENVNHTAPTIKRRRLFWFLFGKRENGN